MRKMLLKLTVLSLVLALILPILGVPARAEESIVPYVQAMVKNYRDYQDLGSEVIEESIAKIAQIDPAAGECWSLIMADWDRCNETEPDIGVLRDGLPEDDSMCIVVLGFELNADGTMKGELISRLEVALESAKKYPNAYIAVAGGGTAANSKMTEARAMANWLMKKGIAEERLIVEDQSLNTSDNAVNTYAILAQHYPQVTGIAVITSDYHMSWGTAMFQTVCNYHSVYGETVIPVIACAANATYKKTDTMIYQTWGIFMITGVPYGV